MKELEKRVEELIQLAKQELGVIIPEYKILFNIASSRKFGGAKRVENSVVFRFNKDVYEKAGIKRFDDVIIHEVAHGVIFFHAPGSQAHGKEWQRVAKILGLSNPTARNRDKGLSEFLPKSKQKTSVAHCGCMEHSVTPANLEKIKEGSLSFCRLCNQTIAETKELSISKDEAMKELRSGKREAQEKKPSARRQWKIYCGCEKPFYVTKQFYTKVKTGASKPSCKICEKVCVVK